MPSKFSDSSAKSTLKAKKNLSTFIDTQIKKTTKKTVTIQYVFLTDTDLLSMNQQFLQHNTFTDIITFDLSENENHIIGEIYISVDRVKENAIKFHVDYLNELHRVVFHGALHLCGYTDKTKLKKEEMRKLEDDWLKKYNKYILSI